MIIYKYDENKTDDSLQQHQFAINLLRNDFLTNKCQMLSVGKKKATSCERKLMNKRFEAHLNVK